MDRYESLRLQLALVAEALSGLGDEAPDGKLDKKGRDGLKKVASVDLANVMANMDNSTGAANKSQ
jgi:hypothetical protein